MKIKITYDGQLMEDLDRSICNAMKSVNAKWYAQGYNFKTQTRDLCFDYYGAKPSPDKTSCPHCDYYCADTSIFCTPPIQE